MEYKNKIEKLLIELSNGSAKAYNKLFLMVYDELCEIAKHQIAGEWAGHIYSKTDLVHELYLKLIKQEQADWKNRNHFIAIASRSMRQILIDQARKKKRNKRGGSKQHVSFVDEIVVTEFQEDEALHISHALDKLTEFDRRLAEIVKLHYFGEMNFDDIGVLLDISSRTVYRDWSKARGWLYKELTKQK